MRRWADQFVKQFSEGDPKYVSVPAQANGVFDEIQNFLRTLPNVKNWQTWANLTEQQYEEVTGGGGIAEYDEEMHRQRDELTDPLLRIMWGIDKRLFDFLMKHTPNIDWGGTTADYTGEIEDLMKNLFASKETGGTSESS